MSKNKKIIFVTILCGLALTLFPSFVFAADKYCCCVDMNTGKPIDYSYKPITPASPPCLTLDESQCNSQCTTQNVCSTLTDATAQCLTIPPAPAPAPPPAPTVQPSSGAPSPATVKLTNPLGKDVTFQIIIGRVISAVLGIVGSIALLMFIYGGFLWLTSHGNEQMITQGKQVLVWATIGLAVIFLSYTLVSFVIKGLTSGASGGGGGTGATQQELNEVVCCYSCSGGKMSNPYMTELRSCTTGNWVSGSCPSAGSACQ